MSSERRTKIVSETERTYRFAVRRRAISFFCPACGAPAEMFSINEAARATGRTWREILSAVETGALHSAETARGEIYVCGASFGDTNPAAE